MFTWGLVWIEKKNGWISGLKRDNEKKIQLSTKNNCKIFEIISPIKLPYKTYAEVHNVNWQLRVLGFFPWTFQIVLQPFPQIA